MRKDKRMNDLITINREQIDGQEIRTVNARELHEFLESKQEFSAWIKSRIEQYDFVENQDYVVFDKIIKNPSGGRPAIEYHITIDMAKELSMVERTEKGRKARRYFIDCERRLKQSALPLNPFQRREVRRMIDGKVRTLPYKMMIGSGYEHLYSEIKLHFGVRSYTDVPAERYDDLLAFIGSYDLLACFGDTSGSAKPHRFGRGRPELMSDLAREFAAALRMARSMGFKGPRAVTAANERIGRMYGLDCIEMMGAMHLYEQNQSSHDLVGAFIVNCCETGSGFKEDASELYREFVKFHEKNAQGFEPPSQKAFGRLMGIRFGKIKQGIYRYLGIRLKRIQADAYSA